MNPKCDFDPNYDNEQVFVPKHLICGANEGFAKIEGVKCKSNCRYWFAGHYNG